MKLVRKHWIILLLTPLVLLLDQTSKLLVHRFFYPYQARQIIPGFLEFRLVFNRGLAFGLFSDQLGPYSTWIFLGITLIAFGIIVHLFFRTDHRALLLPSALSLVLAGALGNLIDRFRWGYVVDFINLYYRRFVWPTFNVADIAITVGIILLLIDSFRPEKSSKPEEVEAKKEPGSGEEKCIQ